jgi:hypothetical protein
MKTDIMFGDGSGTPQPMQQSFMVMKTRAIPAFIVRFTNIDKTDAEISPEMKFWMASTALHELLPISCYSENKSKSLTMKVLRRVRDQLTYKYRGFDVLPFGYGRVRPINFADKFFIFNTVRLMSLIATGRAGSKMKCNTGPLVRYAHGNQVHASEYGRAEYDSSSAVGGREPARHCPGIGSSGLDRSARNRAESADPKL